MFVEAIEFKREASSEYEEGWYVGETDNSRKSVILDANFVPVTNYAQSKTDFVTIWDYRPNIKKRVLFRCE